MEAPHHIAIELVESAYERGPFGAKGVGEMSLVPTLAAVSNAVFAATGTRVKQVPITAPRLLRALRTLGN
jgi:CO/xanthine dehydrogenase Mo-binding subunit